MSRIFAGDRRVWFVAAALGGVLAIAIAISLVERRYPAFTGTNSIGFRAHVVELRKGQRLCVPELRIPARTGFVRLNIRTRSPRPPLAADVYAGKEVIRTGTPGAPRGGDLAIDIPIPERPKSPDTVPGRVCVTPADRAQFGGMPNIYGAHPETAPTIDGRRVYSARVGVWFVPPRDDRQSLLSLFPTILERASLFRPGVVGPWTYSVLLVGVIPLLWIAAIRLLASAGAAPNPPRYIGPALAIAAVTFLNAATWALITPPFNAPDEVDHFAYGQYLAETGNAPSKQPGPRLPWSSEEGLALDGVRLISYNEQPDGRPPWLEVDDRTWGERQARIKPDRDNGGGHTTSATHAPLYYSLLTPAYLATERQSIFSRITAMRLVSALLGALTAVCVFLLVLELLPRQRFLAVAAALLVAFQPMFSFLSGSINNDLGLNAAAALLLLLLVRGLRRGLTLPLAAAIGVVLAVAPLAKATGYALYPAAALAVGGMLWRRHDRQHVPAYLLLAGSFAAAAGAWALIAPLFEHGVFTTPGGRAPTATGGVGTNVLDNPTAYLSYLWQVFLPQLPFMKDLLPQAWPAWDIYVERGWAAFGWYALKFPQWVYIVIVTCMIGTGLLAAITVWRERIAARRRGLELAVLVVALLGVIAGIEAVYFTPAGARTPVAEQGRYAFAAMAALAPIAVCGCLAFGRRLAIPAVTVMVTLVMGLSYASQLLALAKFYA